MIIRDAEIGDSQEVLNWRNDPFTREMSITNDKVGSDEHQRWYEACLSNPHRRLFIGEVGESKVGICRFDYNPITHSSEVSINLNPLERGKKLSFLFLTSAISKYRETMTSKITATIRKENLASLRLFEKCGFQQVSQHDSFVFFILD